MNIGKGIILGGIIALVVGGIIVAIQLKDYKLGLASTLIGIANFILMILK